jgi:hypothetical protein
MKQLEKVQNNTTWAKASNAINNNNDALYVAVTTLERATIKNKGYYESPERLQEKHPTLKAGDIAFVYNSGNQSDKPYDVYEATLDTSSNTYKWGDSGIDAPFASVDIERIDNSIAELTPLVYTESEKEALEDQGLWEDEIKKHSLIYVLEG